MPRWLDTLLFAALGVILAAVAVYTMVKFDVVKLRASAPPAASSSRPEEQGKCPMHAMPRACDVCMQTLCMPECSTCASNVECLELFLCTTECKDKGCKEACAQKHPSGKEALQELVGQYGCLARRCVDPCR